QHIGGFLDIGIKCDIDPVFKKCGIDPDIRLFDRFPANIWVWHDQWIQRRDRRVIKHVSGCIEACGCRIDIQNGLITGDTISGAYFYISENMVLVKEIFFGDPPSSRKGRKRSPTIAWCNTGGSVMTYRGRQ